MRRFSSNVFSLNFSQGSYSSSTASSSFAAGADWTSSTITISSKRSSVIATESGPSFAVPVLTAAARGTSGETVACDVAAIVGDVGASANGAIAAPIGGGTGDSTRAVRDIVPQPLSPRATRTKSSVTSVERT